MKLENAPIKQKLTIAIMLTSAVVLLLTAAVFTVHGILSFRETTEDYSMTIARITAAQSSAAVDYDNAADCRKNLARLSSEPSVLLAALYDQQGKMLAHYPDSAPIQKYPAKPALRLYRVMDQAVVIFVPVRQDNRIVGSLYLKWDLSATYRRIAWAAMVLALLLLGSLGIALVISNALQRRISGPILQLAEISKSVSANRDYSVRAKKYGDDELGGLTDAFNQMLTRIGEQDEALRKNEEQLRGALEATRAQAGEIKTLNADLEDRVARRTSELGGRQS